MPEKDAGASGTSTISHLQANSLRIRAGNLSTRSREFIARSREEQRPARLYGPAIPPCRAAGSARPRPGVHNAPKRQGCETASGREGRTPRRSKRCGGAQLRMWRGAARAPPRHAGAPHYRRRARRHHRRRCRGSRYPAAVAVPRALDREPATRTVAVPLIAQEAHHALRYLVRPGPDRAVRHCAGHLDWSRSRCPRTSMADLRVPNLM